MNTNEPTRLTKVLRGLRLTRVAAQAVCAALLMTLIPVGAAAQYEGYIGVFADPAGSSCDIHLPSPPMFVSLYVVFFPPQGGATAVQFAAPLPAGMTWLSDSVTAPFLSVGNSRNGICIVFGDCYTAPVHVLTINVWCYESVSPCTPYPVVPDPAVPSGEIEWLDCSSQLHYAVGSTAMLNPNGSCPCPLNAVIVDVEPDSLNAPWHLDGPEGSHDGTGDSTMVNMSAGTYTLTWQDVPEWYTPYPESITQDLLLGGYITFSGTYTLLPAQVLVSGTMPVQNALDAPSSTDVSVTFDGDMDAGSINDSTFVVNGMCSGPHAGAISYDAPSRTATLDPAVDFTECEIVTTVVTGMASIAGAPLVDYVWSFTTAAAGGSGAFPDQVVYSVGDGPEALVVAELDGDGHLDLAVASRLSNTVSVHLNQGDGTFAAESTYAVGTTPSSLRAADLDGDGDLDLASTNQSDDSISVLLNQGDGTLAPGSTCASGSAPRSVFASDLDADGDVDLATANWGGDVSVLLNQGDGTFPAPASYNAGAYPRSVFGADLDGDGDVDLAIANETSDDISVFLNQGDGTFDTQVVYPSGDAPLSMFGADLDGDADVDLMTANYWTDDASVFLNAGDGTFAAAQSVPAGDGPQSVFASDLDGDGDLDLTVANVISDNVSVLLNDGDATFAPQQVYGTGTNPNCIFAADLDGDGDLDLATANYISNDVSVLMNNEAVGVQPSGVAPVPTRYALHRIAPNPFGARTTIRYDLPRSGHTQLDIFDVTGRLVRRLTNGEMDAGRYSPVWDGRDAAGVAVAPGVYFVRLEAGSFSATQKVVRMD